jgi:hypothetical protein
MTSTPIRQLKDLALLRTAPSLEPAQRLALCQELREAMAAFDWFTVGVMAADAEQALTSLRQLEAACGWEPMQVQDEALAPGEGVFLKANQANSTVRLRQESGLGEGVLITGHRNDGEGSGSTWGPLPLDCFAG